MSVSSYSTRALIEELGDELHGALVEKRPIPPLSTRGHGLTIDDAYRVQERMVSHRITQGERIVGKKVGATSKAVQSLFNVQQPDFGVLLSGMIYNSGENVPTSRLIQPRAEGEIAFILARDLSGPGLTIADVLAATELVMPCFEIVDSRIEDWKIGIIDTVADNASSGVIAIGTNARRPREVDLELCGMVVEKNGEVAVTGAGAAALGHPAVAVAWLANTLGALGTPLRAGEIILSGALASLVPVQAGDHLSMAIGGLGRCSVSFS
jgi:2-oxopent-4-enoate/cis-2-oxohex-4-enoate hydratase